mmetsp:Transcript_49803/g.108275  ORF Transcript_49803/g.108275 Transcript_49803/m.108275 type:complete len:191 (+) Transcript_49803:66-638(+)|eukprot:CAMPEP_0170602456 /NCGR_PEP_ID=MMETSP0224-20130122/18398_1 /TAXON_ID=285029 /ORGANISM="Togula jolla, Strain CCCM 725" /LENGTH=190 /DNA_ID=CAMNT_0010927291 /DNA_START=65 /DNA_END=637 /DNA_ORIENTATION=+
MTQQLRFLITFALFASGTAQNQTCYCHCTGTGNMSLFANFTVSACDGSCSPASCQTTQGCGVTTGDNITCVDPIIMPDSNWLWSSTSTKKQAACMSSVSAECSQALMSVTSGEDAAAVRGFCTGPCLQPNVDAYQCLGTYTGDTQMASEISRNCALFAAAGGSVRAAQSYGGMMSTLFGAALVISMSLSA